MCETSITSTGYPSIDKPWLKYYSEEAINAPLPKCTIYEYLIKKSEGHLQSMALNYFGHEYSYQEMFAQIDRVAAAFEAAGVQRGDIVTICLPTLPETVFIFYALNKLGAVLNAIDPRLSSVGLLYYLNEVNAELLIVLDKCNTLVHGIIDKTSLKKVVVVSPADSLPPVKRFIYRLINQKPVLPKDDRYISWADFIGLGYGKPTRGAVPYQKDTPAVIVHTGGTTGIAKGVLLSNDNANALAEQFYWFYPPRKAGQKYLAIIPPFVAYGLYGGIHNPLTKGITLCIIPAFDPNKFDKLLLKYKPTHFMGVPVYFAALLKKDRLKDVDMSFLTFPAVGGDSMNTQLENRVNTFLKEHNCPSVVIKGYGLTEVSSAVCGSRADFNTVGSVGIPFIGNSIAIFEPGTQNELGYYQKGEICITGPTTMLGYYKHEAETVAVRQTHKDGRIWIHSGDLGYMNEDGLLFVIDRIKRLIIRSGWNIYPTQIENVIAQHNSVLNCAVIGIPDTEYGSIPKAYIVLKQDTSKPKDQILREIKTLCCDQIVEYAVPEHYCFRDNLPLTPVGKVDFVALQNESI